MPYFICRTCGTQFPDTPSPPERCPICDDGRQYVPPTGQSWTTLAELRATHRNAFQRVEPQLYGIGTVPEFAIGQRALLLRTPAGNVLWDCIALLDDATIDIVNALGGISAIAVSHPHYYTTMVEWAHAFDAPIYLHAADREWVQRPDARISFWDGDSYALASGVTLVRCGGHFPGGTVLHWARAADGQGVLLSGDILQVTADRAHVSFMWSYPNLVPLPAGTIRQIARRIQPLAFERLYGAWWDRHIAAQAKRAVESSVARYLRALQDDGVAGS